LGVPDSYLPVGPFAKAISVPAHVKPGQNQAHASKSPWNIANEAKQTLGPSETLSTMFARISELSSKYNNLVDGRAGGSSPETDPATDSPLTEV
jgi:hypothetical protein